MNLFYRTKADGDLHPDGGFSIQIITFTKMLRLKAGHFYTRNIISIMVIILMEKRCDRVFAVNIGA